MQKQIFMFAISVSLLWMLIVTPSLLAQATTEPEISLFDGPINISSGSTISFGTTTVGTPLVKTFTISNSGNAVLEVSNLVLPNGFELVGSFPSVISPTQTAIFQVRLVADAADDFGGLLQFTTNDGDENPFKFTIKATAASPEITVSVDGKEITNNQMEVVTFGTTPVGNPVTKTFEINNDSDILLIVDNLSLPAGFSLDDNFPTSILPSQMASFQIRLQADTVGQKFGTLLFETNAPDSSIFGFPISGTVLGSDIVLQSDMVSITNGITTPVDFGTTPLGMPVTQTFTISNAGNVPLTTANFTLPAGFMLETPFPQMIVSRETLTFQIVLPADSLGVFSGTIEFETNDLDDMLVMVPISGTVITQPILQLTPTMFLFEATEGSQLTMTQPLAITNNGSGILNWSALESSSWLTLSASSGSGPTDISLTATADGLSAGRYTEIVEIQSNGGRETITVALMVRDNPKLSVTPQSLLFFGLTDGENPASQPLTITNSGADLLTWTITLSQNDWLLITSTTGTATVGQANIVDVGIDLSSLDTGIYTKEVAVSSPEAINSPQIVSVTLVVQSPIVTPILTISPTRFVFTAIRTGNNPSPQRFVITNSGTGNLIWQASEALDWLNLSQVSGIAPSEVEAEINIDGLESGSYRGQILVESENGQNSPQLIEVALNVIEPTGAPVLKIEPPTLNMEVIPTFLEAVTQTILISNLGVGAIDWAASTEADWLTISPISGTTPTTLTAVAQNPSLTDGSVISGQITVQSETAINSPQTIAVTLTAVNPILAVTPQGLNFEAIGQINPSPQNVMIKNLGTGRLDWLAEERLDWVRLSADKGRAPADITINVDARNLSIGTHTGVFTVNTVTGFETVSLTVTVTGRSSLGLVKGGRGFAKPNELITYTISLVNNGNLTATNLTMTDSLPDKATYITGGTYQSTNAPSVSWQIDQLSPNDVVQQVFVVTASQTITNDDYQVIAASDRFTGNMAVVTRITGKTKSSGLFQSKRVPLDLANAADIAVADLNGDGHDDLFVANHGDGQGVPNQVGLGDEQGGLNSTNQQIGTGFSRAVALADFNDDGRVDAIVTNQNSANQVWLNTGNGLFAPGQTLNESGGVDVVVGDVNRDNRVDILIVDSLETGGTIWLNQGNAQFEAATQTISGGKSQAIAMTDFNADNTLDVAILVESNPSIQIWLNDGFGQFANAQQFSDADATLMKVADFNLDGLPDMFVGKQNNQPDELWLNQGHGRFVMSQQLDNGNTANATVHDFDQDGYLDILVSNPQQSQVWFGNTAAQLESGQQRLDSAKASAVLDLDGDGDDDWVVSSPRITDSIWLNLDETTEHFKPSSGVTLIEPRQNNLITIAANSLTQTADLVYTDFLYPPHLVSPNLRFAETAFRLQLSSNNAPFTATFSQPITLVIHYDPAQYESGKLIIGYWSEAKQTWLDAASTCTPMSQYQRPQTETAIILPVCHLTDFALFERSSRPSFYLPIILRQ